MEHFLRLEWLDSSPELLIDAARADRLQHARAALSATLAIEQHYEIVLEMYKSLEKAAFINIERMTHSGFLDYDELFESSVPLNVAMIGLLTAVRLYLDTLVRHTSVPPRE